VAEIDYEGIDLRLKMYEQYGGKTVKADTYCKDVRALMGGGRAAY